MIYGLMAQVAGQCCLCQEGRVQIAGQVIRFRDMLEQGAGFSKIDNLSI